MPPNAFLFVSPDELVAVHREAEKIAKEAFSNALKASPSKTSDPKHSPLQSVRHTIEGRIRGLKQRHDGKMHAFYGTSNTAPTAGIATLAIIATQQQSRSNDAGVGAAGVR